MCDTETEDHSSYSISFRWSTLLPFKGAVWTIYWLLSLIPRLSYTDALGFLQVKYFGLVADPTAPTRSDSSWRHGTGTQHHTFKHDLNLSFTLTVYFELLKPKSNLTYKSSRSQNFRLTWSWNGENVKHVFSVLTIMPHQLNLCFVVAPKVLSLFALLLLPLGH